MPPRSCSLSPCWPGARIPTNGSRPPAAQAYLDAWASGDLTTAAEQTDDSVAALLTLRAIANSMGFGEGKQPLTTVVDTVELNEGGASVGYTATWEFDAAPDWTYGARLELHAGNDDALTIAWAPSVVHPDLTQGDIIEWTRRLPERASILDAAGDPIFTATPVVVVGVDPGRVADLPSLADTLTATLGTRATTSSPAFRPLRPANSSP